VRIPKRLLGNILGKKIRIIKSRDPTLMGKLGVITRETKKMLEITLNNDGRRILVPKHICVFEIIFDEKTKIIIDGKILVNRFRKLKKLVKR